MHLLWHINLIYMFIKQQAFYLVILISIFVKRFNEYALSSFN